MTHLDFSETVFLCRTIWGHADGFPGLGLDGGTSTSINDVLDWIVECDIRSRPVRVDRIDYDDTGIPVRVSDVTDDMRRKLAARA